MSLSDKNIDLTLSVLTLWTKADVFAPYIGMPSTALEKLLNAARDQGCMEEAARSQSPAGEWRPLTDEQRDGEPIIAGSVHHDVREVVCWQDGVESGSFENLMADVPEPEAGWVNTGPSDRFYANPNYFTHYHPLPAPPSKAGGAE